jgi:hypothetical protein
MGRNACRYLYKISIIFVLFYTKLAIYWQVLLKLPSVEFHENQFSGWHVTSCVWMGRFSEFNRWPSVL